MKIIKENINIHSSIFLEEDECVFELEIYSLIISSNKIHRMINYLIHNSIKKIRLKWSYILKFMNL